MKRRNGKLYAVCAVGLVGLIIFALCLPQMVFGFQDRHRCSETNLEKREDLDIAMLSAQAEPFLYDRMTAFAYGLAEGKSYYVSSHEMDMTTDGDLYQKFLDDLADEPPAWVMYQATSVNIAQIVLENNMNVRIWKQYVIYSDDYAQGVNFILWYFEYVNDYGERMDVLLDAQDYTLYGLMVEYDMAGWSSGEKTTLYRSMEEMGMTEGENLDALWIFLGYIYGIVSDKTVESYQNGGKILTDWNFSDENTLNIYLPYEEHTLNVCLKMPPLTNGTAYPGFVFGFEEICRLIPPFSQSF